MTQFTTAAVQTVVVDKCLALPDAVRLIAGEITLELSNEAWHRCADAHDRLATIIREERHVYGITTGFGPLANRLVDAASGTLLQQNLVNHLATGVGPRFGWAEARAIVLARLMSILQGVSGASPEAIRTLVALMNSPFAPEIPSKGTVGASGDLTPLAHMVLCFQGKGGFLLRSGEKVGATAALADMRLGVLDLSRRDGLALVNGTSAMTGVALLNASSVQRALGWSVALTAGLAETLGGRIEAWHEGFGAVRPHAGQIATAAGLRRRIKGSQRVVRSLLSERRLTGLGPMTEKLAGQDAYTLRCAPQVIGAVWDAAHWHQAVVMTEFQSATDNPIFPKDMEDGAVHALHGGNFMGMHVSLASDALANGVVVLAGLAERQMARLTDETLNKGLPAFLLRGPAGLNSGLMGAQVTATALLAEMRTAGAASIQSLSTNGANQDVVSMGTIAARLLAEKLSTLSQIHAILALAVAQAMDILQMDGPEEFSPHALALRRFVRAISPELLQDRPLGREIEALAVALHQSDPPEPCA